MGTSHWWSPTYRVVERAWVNKGEELTTRPPSHGDNIWPHRWSPCRSFSVGRKWCARWWRTCEGANERSGSDEVQEMAEPAEAGLTRFMSRDGERVRQAKTGTVREMVWATGTVGADTRCRRQGDGEESGKRVGREWAGKSKGTTTVESATYTH